MLTHIRLCVTKCTSIVNILYTDVCNMHIVIQFVVCVPQDPHDELKSQNVLIVRESLERVAGIFELDESKAMEMLEESRKILFQQRQLRPKPHRDDKIVTAWNGKLLCVVA